VPSARLERVPFTALLGGSPWRTGATALAVSLMGLVLVYADTALSMANTWWRSQTYAHGMLIPLISAYMVWSRRRYLAEVTPRAAPLGLLALAVLGGGWAVARAADVLVVQQLAFVAMIPVLVATLLGGRVARMLAFPLGYLFFAVPLGEGLIPPLQDFTAHFSVGGLKLTGIPVFAEGRYISIPSGNFEVAEACSGVRYLIASVALGCLFAYLNYRSPWRRLAFIAASALIPVLANGLRAYGIILLAHVSNMRLAVGVDHIIYGWIFFGLVMALLFWLGSFWREAETGPDGSGAEQPRGPGPVSPAPWRFGGVALAALALGGTGPALGAWLARPAAPTGPLEMALPPGSGGWQGPMAAASRWPVVFPGADARIHQRYRREGAEVHLLGIHYRRERQGKELVASQNRLYDGKEWRRLGEASRRVRVAGTSHPVRELRLTDGVKQRVVWSWFTVGEHRTVNPTQAKLWKAWGRLWGEPAGSTLVAVAADYQLEARTARRVLTGFLRDVPALLAPGRVRAVTAEETP